MRQTRVRRSGSPSRRAGERGSVRPHARRVRNR